MKLRIRDLREDKDSTQAKLAEFYGTSCDYLLGITDVSKPYKKTN